MHPVPSAPVMTVELTGLKKISQGKVRDIFELGENLLIVTTDRISAFDSVLPNGIPFKGMVLNQISLFWFDYLRQVVPGHVISGRVHEMPAELKAHWDVLRGRSMLVHRARVLPVECIVRGYLAGSGWKEYRRSGTVCGIRLPEGLQESSPLPEPIFTPSTKAEEGHDENISFGRMCDIIDESLARQVRDISLELYRRAADYARSRGIIIADTKFEFGMVDGRLTLVDEVLSPDSSRFWPAGEYAPGRAQPSFDKQFVRDALNEMGWDHQPPAPPLPEPIIRMTSEKYIEAFRRLTGKDLFSVVES
ncbi:MAG: phosphoribosylaminoimidazolesuccinocarboxamide synthase [Acidobacteria bacterium]|nr:phosphoribosylaminoimidazolesuccinocarboxamide synthase [Acidobacteriota bacterium]